MVSCSKVQGSLALLEAARLEGWSLQFFTFLSSVVVALGNYGQVAYAGMGGLQSKSFRDAVSLGGDMGCHGRKIMEAPRIELESTCLERRKPGANGYQADLGTHLSQLSKARTGTGLLGS